MAQRSRKKPRCWGCGLKPESCACSLLPKLSFATPLVVVQHVGELWKPTNTVRLMQAMLPELAVSRYAMREPPFDASPLEHPDIEFYNLFLRDDAQLITELPSPSPGKRRGFVLLDGTWHQCSRMSRRVPVVKDLPCVALPDGPSSIWRVRTQHDPRGVSSIEAAMRLLELCEGEEKVRPMRKAFEIVTARLLYLKGKLPTPEVPLDWSKALAAMDEQP